ncbi:unnamed protein product [Moneuplotes crassus]|uniref:J domain-containing protein n=1 Tax=Euplotes crassus TaxID=5936 RepID=A0AAD1XRL8_EUPCR|nr:unnamed protein product [Moneuplotes crassus]
MSEELKKEAAIINPADTLKELEAKQAELKKFLANMENTNKPVEKDSQEYHLQRLLNENYVNPYDVLEIALEANEVEIKKRFRDLSRKLHPDKCKHERAADAFSEVEKAYKILMDPDKKRLYQRIMREARERVEIERDRENKKRRKEGKAPLPDDTFNIDVQAMCQKLFDQIEDNQRYFERVETIKRRRMHKDMEKRKIAREVEKEVEREWEDGRDKRAKDWRNFTGKAKGSKKRVKLGLKIPKTRMEKRPKSAKGGEGYSMGVDEGYKREWK